MEKKYNTPDHYLHIGRASDLVGRDRLLYRALEMFPGMLAWGTITLVVFLSAFAPVWAAFFIIIFDLYWLLKTIYLSIHLRANWRRMHHNMELDWAERLRDFNYDHVMHLVVLPFYNEGYEIIERSLEALVHSRYDHKKILVVLGGEARVGTGNEYLVRAKEKYGRKFAHFFTTLHPGNIVGDRAGKGSNISYALEEARREIIDKENIPYENILVSAFDIDTVPYPDYFNCLTWHFLTAEDRYHASYQPVPMYNNNIWDAPALSRVVATSGTFWQMIQQERPERLATFSSHAIPFKTLHEVGYWQRNIVSEDSRIFWNLFVKNNGNYRVVPLSYPVSLDANLAETFWQTTKNVYKQQRRWGWGAENIPYILFNFIKKESIPLKKRIQMTLVQIEGYWSLSTNPILIFLLGWLPLVLGGHVFNATLLSYNLPLVTRDLMVLAMLGLIFSAIISFSFLPDPPANKKRYHFLFMALQWVLVPLTITVFGSIPSLEAQTRLLLSKYMGFWVTPKYTAKKQ